MVYERKNEQERRLLTYEDLERLYGLKQSTAASYVSRGILPCVKLGPRNTRFDPAEIEQWINERRVPQRVG
jgi:predicted DNA-binding transcriptional regulator AlpA